METGSSTPATIETSGSSSERTGGGPPGVGDSTAGRELAPRSLLVVRVRERGTGIPIEGVSPALAVVGDEGFGSLPTRLGGPDARTDADGRVDFEVPHGIALRLLVPGGPDTGGRSVSIPALLPGEQREVSVDVARGLDLEFWARVVSAESGAPVPGARIRLLAGGPTISADADSPPKKLFSQLESDDQGLAHIRVPSWKNVIARIDADGYAPALTAIVQGHEVLERAQVLRLTLPATLGVTVHSGRGSPIPDAQVRLTTPSARVARPEGTSIIGNDPEWLAVTDSDGVCVFEGLPAEVPLRASIHRGGELVLQVADPVVLAQGEAARRTWQVGGGAAIAGILLDPRSQPLAGVEIWLARATAQSGTEPGDKYFWHGALEKPFETARTDAEGRFTFTHVECGDWWVGPGAAPLADDAPAEKSIATRAVAVHIPPESSDIEVVLRAHLGTFLRGRVVGPDGEGVEYAFVHAVPENAAGILSTRCGEDGAFALGPVAPGSFRLQASGREGSADSDPVTARAGDKGIVLKLQTGGVLRGTLLGDEGGPPLSAQLLLCSHDEPQRCLRASAGRDATFEFTGVRGGTYDLVARSGDGRVGVVRGITLASGGENRSVTVSLLPGARLGVRYLGASAWGRFTVLAGTTVIASESIQSGTVSWVGVPEGKLVVRFSVGGFTEERAVEASSARGETEVVFRSE